jgi:nitrogen fixation protein NifB
LIVDCRALLLAGLGNNPRRVLKQKGIDVLELDALEDGETASEFILE